MKQKSYIITSLMRQLTAGGEEREQDKQYGQMNETGEREDKFTVAR